MFEDIRQAFRELLHGNVAPEERRGMLSAMRDTLVRARLALDDLRAGLEVTRRRMATERAELETVRRRKSLAEGIGDLETVTIAERFEAHHLERLVVLERKEGAQASELALVEREVQEMTEQFKSATAGVGSGMAAAPNQDPLDEAAGMDAELGAMGRAQRRAAAEADADARLAELKKRMGK